jgi:hypothetical protein
MKDWRNELRFASVWHGWHDWGALVPGYYHESFMTVIGIYHCIH